MYEILLNYSLLNLLSSITFIEYMLLFISHQAHPLYGLDSMTPVCLLLLQQQRMQSTTNLPSYLS